MILKLELRLYLQGTRAYCVVRNDLEITWVSHEYILGTAMFLKMFGKTRYHWLKTLVLNFFFELHKIFQRANMSYVKL